MGYLNKIISFFKFQFSEKESEIGLIKNIQTYTFDELKFVLKRTTVSIIEQKTNYFLVRFSDPNTEYVISYYLDGKFKAIELEYWKDLNIKFEKRYL